MGTWWSVRSTASSVNAECVWRQGKAGGWSFSGMGARIRVDVYYNTGQGGNGTLGVNRTLVGDE